jgi:hypothetical protein
MVGTTLPHFLARVMVFTWLFLLGWARIVTGRFSRIEIAMTLVIGVASVIGIVIGIHWRTAVNSFAAFGTAVLFGILQLLAFRISLIPYIATR